MGRLPLPSRSASVFVCWLLCASIAALPGAGQSASRFSPSPAQAGKHAIRTVFLIVLENHNWTRGGAASIKGNPSAPYINHTLLPMASNAENYNNPPGNHPSLPNYLWLEAGTNFGIHDDSSPSQHSQRTRAHLTTLLSNAGISWKAYEEDISGTDCPIVNAGAQDPNGNPLYAARHDPFVYFDDVTSYLNLQSAVCIAHIRPFTQLAGDLAAGRQARYNFITPSLCDDMHDTCGGNAIAHGDTWLSKTVPMIMKSAAYRNGGAILIVWDEAATGNGPIGMIALSPLAKRGYANGVYYTHGSTLRSLEEIFGVGPLLGNAAASQDLRDLFSVFP